MSSGSSTARNLLAGLLSSGWAVAIAFFSVPFIVKLVGMESYGLIGFYVTTQTLTQVLDFGIASTINREIAQSRTNNDLLKARTILVTYEKLSWSISIGVFLILVLLLPLIARAWLKTSMDPETLKTVSRLIAVLIATRWPIILYQSYLIGSSSLVLNSTISVFYTTFTSIGAILILKYYSQSIDTYFYWQCFAAAIFLSIYGYVSHRHSKTNCVMSPKADLSIIQKNIKFSLGMSGVTITAILIMQIDKIVLSGMLKLSEFGTYTMAVQAASCLYIFIHPIFNIIYPKISALIISKNRDQLAFFYNFGSWLFNIAIFSIATFGAVYAKELLLLWTRDQTLIDSIAPTIAILLMGTALNGAMHFPYALQLGNGDSRTPFITNIILICVTFPLTLFAVLKLGIIGGAIGWLCLNFTYVFFGTYITQKKYLNPKSFLLPCLRVLLPLLTILVLTYLFHAGFELLSLNKFIVVVLGLFVNVILCVLFWSIDANARKRLVDMIRPQHV